MGTLAERLTLLGMEICIRLEEIVACRHIRASCKRIHSSSCEILSTNELLDLLLFKLIQNVLVLYEMYAINDD